MLHILQILHKMNLIIIITYLSIFTNRYGLIDHAAEGPVLVLGNAAAGVCVDVHASYYHQRPCSCPWSELWPTTKGYAELTNYNTLERGPEVTLHR